jgi:leucyl aminopeptidase
MEFYVRRGRKLTQKDPLVLVGHFEDDDDLPALLAPIDEANGGTIRRLLDDGEFRGKGGSTEAETALVHLPSKGPRRVLLHGLGKREEFDADVLRRSVFAAVRAAQKARVPAILIALPRQAPESVPLDLWVRIAIESASAATYRYLACKGKASRDALKDRVDIAKATFLDVGRRRAALQRGMNQGLIMAEAVTLARDLGNTPGSTMTPTRLAARAREVGRRIGAKVTVMGPKEIAAAKMGGLMAVARGSSEQARFIVIDHAPKKPAISGTWCVVGKGLTFDAGGICLKPGGAMDEMKFDMCGGAATLGVMLAVGMLNLPMRVMGIVPASENLPGGKAYKPGDVLKMMNGNTVEIINTDAEGRLILADALTYAVRRKPKAIIDMATLTGACVVALGHALTGLVGNDDALAEGLAEAGKRAGDRAWRMPLTDDFREAMMSTIADVKNSGGRWGGVSTAAAFLEKFVKDVPWAHLDIAGTAWTPAGPGPDAKGATGAGVGIVTQYLMDLAAPRK